MALAPCRGRKGILTSLTPLRGRRVQDLTLTDGGRVHSVSSPRHFCLYAQAKDPVLGHSVSMWCQHHEINVLY